MAWILILVIAAAVVFGYIQIPGLNLGNLKLPFSISGNNTNTGNNVTRKLEFSFTNQYTGAASATKTFYIYNPAGALLETLTTDSNGIKDTARTYTTGDLLYIKYVDGNVKLWYQLTVPGMSSNDAFSQSVNPVSFTDFSIGTYSGTLTAQGTAYATNYADGNGTTPSFNFEIVNTGADGTGMMNSMTADPVYGQTRQAVLVATITGTGYAGVSLTGFDQIFTLGTTEYGVKAVDVNQLTRWKVGNTYQMGYQGDQVQSFGVDLSGLTVNSTTLTLTVKAYADVNYAMNHGGNFGADAYTLATATCNFIHYS